MNNKHQNNKQPSFGLNVGTSSLLMIFIILCLVSFAALSITSSLADSHLSEHVIARNTSYYEACNKAEKDLEAIDKTLMELYKTCADEEEYFNNAGHEKSYIIPISDLQALQVSINILYPQKDDDTFYEISNWQVINLSNLE